MSTLEVIRVNEKKKNKKGTNIISYKPKYRMKNHFQELDMEEPKKININKFLTRCVYNEQKKFFELEKKRFEKMLGEQNACNEKPNLNINNSLEKDKKKPIYLKTTESFKSKVKKKGYKKNHTIEGDKINKSLEEKYKNRNLITIQIDKMFNKKKERNNSYISEQVCKKYQKTNKSNEMNNLQANKKNSKHMNNKTKYRHDKILNNQYKKYELKNLKKTYLRNKNLQEFHPTINNNKKYKNVSSKYKESSQKFITKSHNYSTYERHVTTTDKTKSMYNNSDIGTNKNNDFNIINLKYNLRDRNKGHNNTMIKHRNSNFSMEGKNWVSLLRTINRQKVDGDNTYYINVNESTSCNKNKVNNVFYNKKFREILDYFIE